METTIADERREKSGDWERGRKEREERERENEGNGMILRTITQKRNQAIQSLERAQ